MNLNDLRSVSDLARQYGVKCLAYGPPGSGKTPIAATAPNPVLCVTEPGMLSMRAHTNVPAFEAYTADRIEEFFRWLAGSKEADTFDTIVVDSMSQLAEIILTEELKRNKDGRKAYGEMSRRVMSIATQLYFAPRKHVYLIAKQSIIEENSVSKRRPYFPGQDLNIKIPHLYDEILHIALANVPGVQGETRAIRCHEAFDVMARDRSGKLSTFEPPNLAALFSKAMS